MSSCEEKIVVPKVVACFIIFPDLPADTPVTDLNFTFDITCTQNATKRDFFLDGSKMPLDNSWFYEGRHAVVGNHTVLLVASNENSIDSMRKSFHVTATKPKACFSSTSPYMGDTYFPVNSLVTFDAGCSYHQDTTKYNWVIDDINGAIKATGRFITHKWIHAGHYNVKLSVINPSQTLIHDTNAQITIH